MTIDFINYLTEKSDMDSKSHAEKGRMAATFADYHSKAGHRSEAAHFYRVAADHYDESDEPNHGAKTAQYRELAAKHETKV